MVLGDGALGYAILDGVFDLGNIRAHDIAEAWIKHTTKHIGVEAIEFDQIAFELDSACAHDPDLAWEIIKIIADMYQHEDISENRQNDYSRIILENLASGPLEDLLTYHGKNVISKIEIEAAANDKICWLLKKVWRNEIDQQVWDRIQRISC